MDQRIGMGMAGDLGRYTQFETAQSLPIAAANAGGAAGMGVGLGAGVAMGQSMMATLKPAVEGTAALRGSRQILYRVRKARSRRRALLPGVWKGPMNCPSCGAAMRLHADEDCSDMRLLQEHLLSGEG